jgi:hypothetical protein
MSRLDSLLEAYRRTAPERNLSFLESRVHARLKDASANPGLLGVLAEGFAHRPIRFAAVALAFFMGTGLGMFPDTSTAPSSSEFAVFSEDAPYLPSTLLGRHD